MRNPALAILLWDYNQTEMTWRILVTFSAVPFRLALSRTSSLLNARKKTSFHGGMLLSLFMIIDGAITFLYNLIETNRRSSFRIICHLLVYVE